MVFPVFICDMKSLTWNSGLFSTAYVITRLDKLAAVWELHFTGWSCACTGMSCPLYIWIITEASLRPTTSLLYLRIGHLPRRVLTMDPSHKRVKNINLLWIKWSAKQLHGKLPFATNRHPGHEVMNWLCFNEHYELISPWYVPFAVLWSMSIQTSAAAHI